MFQHRDVDSLSNLEYVIRNDVRLLLGIIISKQGGECVPVRGNA
jgi:hypothetical protein